MAKERILVVDDEEDILELVRYNLAREGYHVAGTLSGEEALKKARTEAFDLIALDLMLPGIDGLEVTKKLKGHEKTRHIPIVMLTAKGEEAGIVTGLELGGLLIALVAAAISLLISRRITRPIVAMTSLWAMSRETSLRACFSP